MIASLHLQQFRSYVDASFEFEPGVNVVVGPNTSGKTNLLEGILVVAQGISYRTATDKLIHDKDPWARLESLNADNTTRVVTLKRQAEANPIKEFTIDDKKTKRLNFEQKIPVVLFEPNQLIAITTAPEKRRELLDELLGQIDRNFSRVKREYKKTLAQRNALLKQGHATSSTLFPWDIRLSETGGQIARARLDLVDKLNQSIATIYSSLADEKHAVRLQYVSGNGIDNYTQTMLRRLQEARARDEMIGYTTVGPHRDDLEIQIDQILLQQGCSRGEIRTALLALKICQAELIQEALSRKPILLLDDVFGELDGSRRKALTKHLRSYQTVITTTDADVIAKNYSHANHIAL
ncbi:DNA replication and repair protein RecF [Candidatus Saccharibacteria bacterium]|nr:DNA replication and repair protein RecF [Candidatus Saccharibacteria bacterium]